MSKKKWCGLLAILMAASIVFTSGALRPVNVYAETIADLQEQSEEHQKKLEEINQQIEEAEANKADALEQKNLLDQQADILRSQISNAQQQIDALEAELADNQQKEEAQYDLFCRQVRAMEEERGHSCAIWSVLFKATSFSDLLGRLELHQRGHGGTTSSVIDDLRAAAASRCEDEAGRRWRSSAPQLESRQAELDSQSGGGDDSGSPSTMRRADGLNALAAIRSKAAEPMQLDAQIEARKRKQSRRTVVQTVAAAGGGRQQQLRCRRRSSGGYIWPVETAGSSPPPTAAEIQAIPGASTTHKGVDIGGASYGSYVYAAKAGTVIGSQYSQLGYGNYVVIEPRQRQHHPVRPYERAVWCERGASTWSQGDVIGLYRLHGHLHRTPPPLRDHGERHPQSIR